MDREKDKGSEEGREEGTFFLLFFYFFSLIPPLKGGIKEKNKRIKERKRTHRFTIE